MSRSDGFCPGSAVETRATFSGRNAAIPIGAFAAASTAWFTAVSGAANGMIFTVATISPGATAANGASVATVIDSSIRLSASTCVRVEHDEAGFLRVQIDAPGEGRADADVRRRASACAMRVAAISSGTSPASRRATVTSEMPASRSWAISAAVSIRPFLIKRPPARRLCTRIAPSVSPSGKVPNRM